VEFLIYMNLKLNITQYSRNLQPVWPQIPFILQKYLLSLQNKPKRT
jgi:hypothetical protein